MAQLKSKRLTHPKNDMLRNAGAQIALTQHQTQEYIRCKLSFEYFASNYIKIVSLDGGLINFNMRGYQEEMFQMMEEERFVIAKIPRQYGKTILVVSYFLWKAIFNKTIRIGIFADTATTAQKILEKLQVSYEQLPLWLQQGVIDWAKGKIKLENGSVIECAATTGNSGRSGSYNYILLDEFAHVPSNLQHDFYGAVYPTIMSGSSTKMFIISTPKGMELFYKIWSLALQGKNRFKTMEVHWSKWPGRDQKWKEETVADIGIEKFDQEYGCEFIGSSGVTLIDAYKLKNMPFVEPGLRQDDLEIYRLPSPDRTYILTVDTSQGVGADYAAFSVIDVTTLPYIQVAKYRNNKVSQTEFPLEIYKAGMMYNSAYVLIEINEGRQVGDLLYMELEYPAQLFTYRKWAGTGQRITLEYNSQTNPGIIMSHAVKKTGMSHLKNLIENNQLQVLDFDTISELTTFVRSGSTFRAEGGKTDDMVMTLIVFAWLALQPFFREVTDANLRNKVREEKEKLEEQLGHPGFKADSMDEGEPETDEEGIMWNPIQRRNPWSMI